MTERLYYSDSYLTRFTARLSAIRSGGRRVLLDRTAFYPTSGGQPFDVGTIEGTPVVDVVDEDADIVHVLDRPLAMATGSDVRCEVDWARRFDHMQQHTGQHLLSALLADRHGWPTVSVHFGDAYSTVDVVAGEVAEERIAEAEQLVNAIITANHPVEVSFEDARTVTGLRKPSDRDGLLRVVSIGGIDRSACGGTHVARTGEVGALLLRRVERTKGQLRIEFVCGARAVRAARHDYLHLHQAARVLSAAPAELPALVEGLSMRARELEREQRRLLQELAAHEASALWKVAPLDTVGRRRVHLVAEHGHARDRQALATAITALGGAVVVVEGRESRSILLATSDDSGQDAGQLLKPLLATHGGRGGGSPRVAQGTLPDSEALAFVVQALAHD
jgi:alanyl-tRNA synthetase